MIKKGAKYSANYNAAYSEALHAYNPVRACGCRPGRTKLVVVSFADHLFVPVSIKFQSQQQNPAYIG